MAPQREHDVTTPDGRTLRVLDVGAGDGPVLVVHHGTPGARPLYRTEVESAAERGLRLVAYDRPGFGGAPPGPGPTRRAAPPGDPAVPAPLPARPVCTSPRPPGR